MSKAQRRPGKGPKTQPKTQRKTRPKTPEQRRIAAGQALIRRCHSDREFRKKIIALWRAQMEQDSILSGRSKTVNE